MANIDDTVAYMPGAASLPRRNGEIVFDAPWQSRAFGLAVGLSQAGMFPWDEFRDCLIASIARWEASGHPAAEWSYWERWLDALEHLLEARGIAADSEIDALMQRIAATPDH
jgi:nitrile hydratase accessory protein